ncbi:annexin D4-like [Euphorbia lathyris]|uniref:annexin D4-like n=1 Tax=Euphorbia lathyris TaxID=212925 RepID=UPI003313FB93
MAQFEEVEALTRAFSEGLGVDEKLLISTLGKSHAEHRTSFRKRSPSFFIEDEERSFERWDDRRVHLLRNEFVRFENSMVLWTMHPWERDARLLNEALKEGPNSYGVIVEVSCTRSSEGLLGARKAYHSLFDHSIEEDVATCVTGSERKLLVALVSAYRYEGPKVKEDIAKSEAKILANAIKNGDKKNPIEDDEVVRILTTRSKSLIKSICNNYYKDVSGKNINEDLEATDLILKEIIQCLTTPQTYFIKVLDEAMKPDADSSAKNALTRVIITQADADLKALTEQYQSVYGVSLSEKIESIAKGNYKDFLLALLTGEKN